MRTPDKEDWIGNPLVGEAVKEKADLNRSWEKVGWLGSLKEYRLRLGIES